MPYKKPCGESNRVPVGTPGADYTTNDECLSAMKRAGGGEAPFAQIQEIQARI